MTNKSYRPQDKDHAHPAQHHVKANKQARIDAHQAKKDQKAQLMKIHAQIELHNYK